VCDEYLPLVFGEMDADSYTDPLWKALAHDGRLPQPDIHTGHRTAIGAISPGYTAASGRGGAPALGADYPSAVRRRERGTHQGIERAHRRIAALLKTEDEALISTYLVGALRDRNAAVGDPELSRLIAALRGRIPVIPTQRWTAGLDQMPDNTQEALVYASPPTGAVYKLIVANNDGTVKGAVRLDEVAVDPQGRP